MKPAIFLDRDNTLIHNDGDLGDPDQVKMIQGAASAIASLRGLGYQIIVVSNQGGVARGRYAEADVDAVHRKIAELIKTTSGAKIDRFYFCPYHPQGSVPKYAIEHPWRKPQPGMLLEAAKQLHLDLQRSWMIGDQPRDVQAGIAVGTRTILLHNPTDRREADPAPKDLVEAKGIVVESTATCPDVEPEFTASSLIEAVKIVASQRVAQPAHRTPELKPQAQSVRTSVAPVTLPSTPTVDRASGVSKPEPEARDSSTAGTVSTLTNDRSATARQTTPTTASSAATRPGASALDEKPHQSASATPAPGYPATESSRATLSAEVATTPEHDSLPSPDGKNFGSSAERTLREILQELRNQRAKGSDFSYTTVLAIVLQMVAAVCALGGLWLGSGDAVQFQHWISIALFVQLCTIAVLLFRR